MNIHVEVAEEKMHEIWNSRFSYKSTPTRTTFSPSLLFLLPHMSPTLHPTASAVRSPCPWPHNTILSHHQEPLSVPPVESLRPPGCPPCQCGAEAHLLSNNTCVSTRPSIPSPPGHMGQPLKLLCSRISNCKQGKHPCAPGFPSCHTSCCPFPLRVTAKEGQDVLLHHSSSYLLSCLLCLPEVFMGREESSLKSGVSKLAQGGPNPGPALLFYGPRDKDYFFLNLFLMVEENQKQIWWHTKII